MDVNNKLKIAHCIASMDRNSGGTTTAVLDILVEQSKFADIELYTLNSSDQVLIPSDRLRLYSENPSFLDYSIGLKRRLKESNADIFHVHALWNLPMHQTSAYARKINKKYVISVHGMLHPWAIENKGLKKKIALKLYQHLDLLKANCLHATSFFEAQYIKNQGYKNPIAVIPNGINLSDYPLKNDMVKNSKRKVLFLSRIHFQKGIEELISAWSNIPANFRSNWELEIIGSGDSEYINGLINRIEKLNVQEQIKIGEAQYGEAKIQAYHSADLFVLPTYSENFGMVVAEALSCGVPVVTTKGTPWKDLEDYNAGSWIEIGVEPLRKTLEEYLQKESSELESMGRNGRKLVTEKYSIESVGEKFKKLYEWMLNKGEKPEFVL